MKNLLVWISAVVLIVSGLLAASVWRPEPAVVDEGLVVGATIFPLADIVQEIGGQAVKVVLLIPPGTTEHSSSLSPQTLAAFERAKTLFAIGHGLDDRLVDRVTQGYAVPIVIVDKGIVLNEFSLGEAHAHEGEEAGHLDEGVDPHYWLAVAHAQKIARTVTDELVRLDGSNAAVYERNFMQYTARLATLDADLKRRAGRLTQPRFMTMHNAWGYFAQAYGLELVGTYEPVEGREPSLIQLQELREIISEAKVHIFYAEPQKSSTAAVAFLQKEFGLTILTLDPIGGLQSGDSYIEMMDRNMSAIEAGQ